MENIRDDRGFNQIWAESRSTLKRAERRCDCMISEMEVDHRKRVMEIGCGTGAKTFMLAQKTGMYVLGTDLCASFIEEANIRYQAPKLRFEMLDFRNPDRFKDERFDYIVGDGILHHLYHHLEESLADMRQLLKTGGKIIFMEPNLFNPYVYLIFSFAFLRAKARLEPDEMAFSKPCIAEKLSRAGYSNINVEFKDFLVPGTPDFLVTPSIVVGSVLERIPLLQRASQSLFISAQKQSQTQN